MCTSRLTAGQAEKISVDSLSLIPCMIYLSKMLKIDILPPLKPQIHDNMRVIDAELLYILNPSCMSSRPFDSQVSHTDRKRVLLQKDCARAPIAQTTRMKIQ